MIEINRYWLRFELYRKGAEISFWTVEKFFLGEMTLSEAKKEFKKWKKLYSQYKTVRDLALLEEKTIKMMRVAAR